MHLQTAHKTGLSAFQAKYFVFTFGELASYLFPHADGADEFGFGADL